MRTRTHTIFDHCIIQAGGKEHSLPPILTTYAYAHVCVIVQPIKILVLKKDAATGGRKHFESSSDSCEWGLSRHAFFGSQISPK